MRERERKKMESWERKNTVKRVFNRNSRDDSLTSDFERRKSGSKVRTFRELIFRDDAASKSKTYSTLFVRENPRVSRSWTSTLRVPVSICGLRSRSNENSTFRSLIHDAISRPSNWKFRVREDNDRVSIWVMAPLGRRRDIFNVNRNIELW